MGGAEDDGFSFCMETLLERLVQDKGVRCGVCMRGGEEITLVRPRRVKELIQYHGFKIFEPVDSTMPWACVLCESSAAHALRAHVALRCAARITALVTELRVNGLGTNTNTRANNNKYSTEARRVTLSDCETMLRSVRSARRLVRTDVLVVDSTGVRASGDAVGHKRAATNTPSRTPSGLRPIAPFTSEVVILDDDEDPLAMSPALPSLGPPSTVPPSTGPPATGKLVQLTPLVSLYNPSNVMYVPQHNNNQNVIVFIDNDCTVQEDDIAELMLKGTDVGARKRARLGGSGGSDPPGGGGHYVVDIDDVTGMIKEQNRKQQNKDDSIVAIRPAPAGGRGRGTGRGRGAGRAVPSGARVDWEDKIPMDVISFMDATDPNAAELIVPERSLTVGGHWDPPPLPEPPIIDLS